MKTALRRLFFFVVGIVLILALGVFVPRPLFQTSQPETKSQALLLISSAIHTDIALPLDEDLRSRFAFLDHDGLPLNADGARWLVIGWGGRSFYTQTPNWSELKLAPVLKALTLDRSVLHLEILGDIPLFHPAVTPLQITPAGRENLLRVVDESFDRDASGRPILVPQAAYGSDDAFYEAVGSFNALAGCNTWTAKALRAAGLTTGLWNPIPQSLGLSLALFNKKP